jgi:flagellar hook-length control protein FliK
MKMTPTATLPALLSAPQKSSALTQDAVNGQQDAVAEGFPDILQGLRTAASSATGTDKPLTAETLLLAAAGQGGNLLQGAAAVGAEFAEMDAAEALDGILNLSDEVAGLQQSDPELARLVEQLGALLQGEGDASLDAWLDSAQAYLMQNGVELPGLASAEATAGQGMASPLAETLAALLQLLPAELQQRLRDWANSAQLPAADVALDGEAGESVLPSLSDSTKAAAVASPAAQSALKSSTPTSAAALEGAPAAASDDPPSMQQELRRMIANLQNNLAAEPNNAQAELNGDSLRQSLSGFPDSASPRMAAAPLTSTPGAAPAAAPGSANTPVLPSIAQPPGDHAWGKALGERVMWMLGKDMQSAELRLTPPQLGPVEIRVTMQNDQASVSFTAAHPFTREALEAALPRLREMFGESNLELVDVDVSDRQSGRSPSGEGEGGGTGEEGFGWDAETDELAEQAEPISRQGVLGLVDYFA